MPISQQSGGSIWLTKTVPTSSGWGIFWLRQDPGANSIARLYYAHVNFTGQLTHGPLAVIDIPKISFRSHYYMAAWHDDHYGLLIADRAQLFYYNLSLEGVKSGQRIVGPTLFTSTVYDQESDGDLDSHPGGFLGVVEGECEGHSCSYAFKLGPDGVPAGAVLNLVDFDFTHQFYPTAAYDGSGFAILSVKDIQISGGGVMTKYLSPNGSLGTHSKVIPSKEYLWDEFPDIAWNGTYFGALWTENSARSHSQPWQIHFAAFRRTSSGSTLIGERVLDQMMPKSNHRWTTQVHGVGSDWVVQYGSTQSDGSILGVYEWLDSTAQSKAVLTPFTLTADALGSSAHFAAGAVGSIGIARGDALSGGGTQVTFQRLDPPACAP